ncbi:MAG TPA: PASTA domain-containing protein [Gaiellaceae bacterium]|nr:PASTA domain-containing protein [Gaiellaceae bacterium]
MRRPVTPGKRRGILADDFCCADDQAVSGWFSDEFNLLHMEWGWPGGDSRALAACDRLGGYTVAPDGRIDTSEAGAFEDSGSVCEPGHGVFERRMGISDRRAFYVQVRFLCNSRYPCGGHRFILSRAVRVTLTGLPPPPPTCHVPRVIGLRLATARARIRRANCAVGRIRRVRSQRVGRVVAQSSRAGTAHRRGFPIRLVVGRR